MQVFTNRYLEFSNRIIAKHSGFGYYYDSISLLFPEEEKGEMSNEYGKKDSIINLYQIQYLQEHNHLFQKNISFVTKLFMQKVNQTLLPTMEQQAAKIISKELTGVSHQVIEKITKEYIEKATTSEEKNIEIIQTLVNRFAITQQQISNHFLQNASNLADEKHDFNNSKVELTTQIMNKSKILNQSQNQIELLNQTTNNFYDQNQVQNQNQIQNKKVDQKADQKIDQKINQKINQKTETIQDVVVKKQIEKNVVSEVNGIEQNIQKKQEQQAQQERNWNRVVRNIENILVSNNQTMQINNRAKINNDSHKKTSLGPVFKQEQVAMSHTSMNELLLNENVRNQENNKNELINSESRVKETRSIEIKNTETKNTGINPVETKDIEIRNTETLIFPVINPELITQKQKESQERKTIQDKALVQHQELDLTYTKSENENDMNLHSKNRNADFNSIKNQQKEQFVDKIMNSESVRAMNFLQTKNSSMSQRISSQHKFEKQKNQLQKNQLLNNQISNSQSSSNQEILKQEINTPVLRTIQHMILELEHNQAEKISTDKKNDIINNNINNSINNKINNASIINTANMVNTLNNKNNIDLFKNTNILNQTNNQTSNSINNRANNQTSNRINNHLISNQIYENEQTLSLILPEESNAQTVKEVQEKQIPTVIRQTIRQITREIERQQHIENRYIIGHERIERKMSTVLQQFLNQDISKIQVQNEMVAISNEYQTLVYQTLERSKKSQDYIKKAKVQISKSAIEHIIESKEHSIESKEYSPESRVYSAEQRVSSEQKKFGRKLNLVYEKETDEMEKEKKHDQKLIRDTKEEIFQDIQFLKSTEIKTEQKIQEQKIVQDLQEMKHIYKSKENMVEEQQHNILQKEIRETISQQVDESINVIANRVYSKLESRLKSERSRRGLN